MDATQVAALCHLPKDEPGLELVRFRLLALTQHCFNLPRGSHYSQNFPYPVIQRTSSRSVFGETDARETKTFALTHILLSPDSVRPGVTAGLRLANLAFALAGWG